MAISFTAADIRPLPGAVIENPVVSGTVYVGWAVYNNGGSATGSNGGATATAYAYGIVVACPNGGTSAVTGDRCDVVTFGRVTGFASLTIGTPAIYTDNSAGLLVQGTGGTVAHKLGVARDATTIFVNPSITQA